MTKLKERRLSLRLKLREVAEKMQKSVQDVHQQENRGIRTLRTARLYAEALSCNWIDLIDDSSACASAGKQ